MPVFISYDAVKTPLSVKSRMYLLSRATQTLPMGTAYALWVGIGAVGTCLFGMLFLNEPFTVLRLFFLVMLVISLIGLKMTAV
ncbi:MAG: SMR family transporter [Bdellovibrionota bacterium]|nr:SMR family transporter [Bdellovibrionota bacterium]